MMKNPTILAFMPTHSTTVDASAYRALRSPTLRAEYQVSSTVRQSSLLAAGFNGAWCQAINDRYDYFVMLHSDIAPQDGWLDILMDEMARTEAEVMSAVVPIKDHRGLTSTAIGEHNNNWNPRRRLTMHEVYQIPETFDAASAGYPDDILLVNTGCLLIDLSRPWCRATTRDGTAEFHFTINDRIVFNDGQFSPEVESEDWYASRQWARLGVKVMATRKVSLDHRAVTSYSNTSSWGSLKEDGPINDNAQMVKRGCPYRTSDGTEVIHVHIPKTGGTSFWQIIGKPPEVNWRTTHLSVSNWRQRLGAERYDNAISFAVVRNPYDRLYSAWAYFTGPHPESPTWPALAANSEWVKRNSGPDCTFEHFLLNTTGLEHREHFMPQHKWLSGNRDGTAGDTPDVTHQLRFENLRQEWDEFCAVVGLDVDPLPHRNASTRGEWEDAYTPEMIERANELYAQDFESLPYEMLSSDQFAGSPALTV